MTKPSVSAAQIIRVTQQLQEQKPDLLAVEEPLEIRIGYGPVHERLQKRISVTMRTPGHDFELAAGFLFTENIITSPTQVHSIQYCTELNSIENKENIVRVELHPDVIFDAAKLQRNFYTTSSCGVCGKESIEAVKVSCRTVDDTAPINASIIYGLPGELLQHQNVFGYTGGMHASAVFTTEGELLLVREDVGRHNALDKLIGAAGFGSASISLSNSILLLSGRASFELLQKATVAQIPIICAVGAPSSLAVEMAQQMNITLVGFLREQRFNIYTRPQRVIV